MATLFKYQDKDFILSQTLDTEPNPSHFKMHTHTTVEVYAFLRGKAVFHIEGSAYPLEPGDLLIMRPAESHCIEVDTSEPYERRVLNFSPACFQSIDPQNLLMRPVLDRMPGKGNLYRGFEFPDGGCDRYFQTMMRREGDSRLNLLAGLIPMLSQLYRIHTDRADAPQQEPDTPEYRIIFYINQNLGRSITLDDLCDRFFISKSQLCRLFKRSTGTTVGHYITVKRLLKARQLLDAGERPTHVFTRCGFADYSVFYRAYVKHFGCAPTGETL